MDLQRHDSAAATTDIHTGANDEVQDLLGKGDDNTASQGQEAVGPLGRVMGLEGTGV